MGVEDRIRYLMKAALRAEAEGDDRVARTLRRMAEEALPVVPQIEVARLHPTLGCCTE